MLAPTAARTAALLVLFAAALAALPAGCASTPTRVENPVGYVALYESGRYSDALRAAASATASPSAREREQASLIAGLSAHALNRTQEADRWLRPLLESSDRQLSGRAAATLGLIAQEQKLHQQAARLLTQASGKLTGDEGARASLYAGDSLRATGERDQATAMYQRAARMVQSDDAVRRLANERLAGAAPAPRPPGTTTSTPTAATPPGAPPRTGGAPPYAVVQNVSQGPWTVQVGAFSDVRRANEQAARVRASAARLGLGEPRVRVVTSSGRTLHAVQVGTFNSRVSADRARASLGSSAVVTSLSR